MQPMRDDLEEILITEQQIQQRMDALALEIQREYAEKDLTLVAVLTGSVMFIADLLRRLPMQLRFDYIGVSSYHGETRTTGDLIVTKALTLDVRGHDVLVVDDILDTGTDAGENPRDDSQAAAAQPRSSACFWRKTFLTMKGSKPTLSASASRTSSSSATDWTIRSGTATCRASAR